MSPIDQNNMSSKQHVVTFAGQQMPLQPRVVINSVKLLGRGVSKPINHLTRTPDCQVPLTELTAVWWMFFMIPCYPEPDVLSLQQFFDFDIYLYTLIYWSDTILPITSQCSVKSAHMHMGVHDGDATHSPARGFKLVHLSTNCGNMLR